MLGQTSAAEQGAHEARLLPTDTLARKSAFREMDFLKADLLKAELDQRFIKIVATREPNSRINLEKAVNHGVHSDHCGKSRASMSFSDHPQREYQQVPKTLVFRRVRRTPRVFPSGHVRCG